LSQVVKSFLYPLTDPRQFDILQSGPAWRGSNAIRSIEAPRVHHAHRRCRDGVAAPGARAAEMIGTTRSRVSFFMNKFRKLGFIEYNGKLEVHNSLLNVVLHDKPEIKMRDEAIGAE
jgi:hypothetical protein